MPWYDLCNIFEYATVKIHTTYLPLTLHYFYLEFLDNIKDAYNSA